MTSARPLARAFTGYRHSIRSQASNFSMRAPRDLREPPLGTGGIGEPTGKRLRPVRTQGVGGSATAWQSMGCAETVALTLRGDESRATHHALAQPFPAARGPRRSLTVVPLAPDQRYYGETTGRLLTYPRRRAERAGAGEGPEARLFGGQPGPAVSQRGGLSGIRNFHDILFSNGRNGSFLQASDILRPA